MAEDGRKMSKRWGNVINPDDVVREYGADAMRVYEMFMGPFGESVAWSTKGVVGCRKFLDKVLRLSDLLNDKETTKLQLLLQQTIKKVTIDIQEFKLNTAISAMMILVNTMMEQRKVSREAYEKLLTLLAPFAPHLTEEIWEKLGHKNSILREKWPEVNEEILQEADVKIMLQINGKLRGEIMVAASEAKDQELVMTRAKNELIENNKLDPTQVIRKEIYIAGRIVNLVV
jgi:leucyl-tRNA synthetase